MVDPTLNAIINNQELRWIFVGGKGGVGKTTTSCSLALALAKTHESVLLISTDPAHNLADAFDQEIGSEPTLINGVSNLWAVEIEPKVDPSRYEGMFPQDEASRLMMAEMATSVPGVDEAIGFGELMKSVQEMKYSVIVFDTAPTGHTLRLLNFPQILDKGLEKLLQVKPTIESALSSMLGIPFEQVFNNFFTKIQEVKAVAVQVNEQFRNPRYTTFVGVCVPEYLSLYETEKLVKEIFTCGIDIGHLVVNMVMGDCGQCTMCGSRQARQAPYLQQIADLYADFHVVQVPMQMNEVRGVEDLSRFGKLLV